MKFKLVFFCFLLILIGGTYNITSAQKECDLLSIRGYGGNRYDQVATNQVVKMPDSGFIIALYSESDSGTGNIDSLCPVGGVRTIFIKYKADGMGIDWIKCNATAMYLFPAKDGGAVLMNNYGPSIGWGFHIWKEDSADTVLWDKGYSKGNGPILRATAAANDGGYFMFGETNDTDSNATIHYGSIFSWDLLVIRVDGNGDKIWSKVFGGTDNDYANSVVPAPDGGCYIFGYTYSNDYDCTGNHGGADGYLARLDSNGNMLWHQDLGGSSDEGYNYYSAAVSNGTGGVLLAIRCKSSDGEVHNHKGSDDFWVLEVDSNGHIIWDNCFGGYGDERPNAICKANDGTIWVAGLSITQDGQVDTAYGNGDAWIVHTDSAGNYISSRVIGSSGMDGASLLVPLPSDNVLVGGYYSGYGPSGELFPATYYGLKDVFLAMLSPRTVSVQDPYFNSSFLHVYPNPATDKFTIKVSGSKKYNFSIDNLLGCEVLRGSFNGSVNINTAGWPRGSYFVQVTSDDGYKTVAKILMQ